MISPTCTAGICPGLPSQFFKTSGAPASAGYFCLSRVGCARSHATMPNERLSTPAAALVVWIATTLVSVDDSVNFGIIYCMAVCTAVVAFTRPLLQKLPGSWGIAACLVLFALTWGIPKAVYPLPYLAWLGFPGPGFVSGDYYPLIPFVFMYLTGFFAAQAAQNRLEAPAWAYANPIPALAVLGRHALPFYLLHQPVILGVLEIVYSVR